MNIVVRRLRGIVGMGLTWAVVWSAILYAVAIALYVARPQDFEPGEEPRMIALFGAAFGFISRGAFSLLLMAADRKQKLENLSLARAAIWGALGTALFPIISGGKWSMLPVLCPIGAALAVSLVALAKKANRAGTTPTPQH